MIITPDTTLTHADLTDKDRAILDFESRTWKWAGLKERHIREELQMRPTQYYQRLNVLLDNPNALAYSPITVNRLRRVLGR